MIHAERLDQLVQETRDAAQTIEHPWDRRALDWPLDQTSLVVEVGGYKGRWALQIAERYAPRLFIFEPQPWAAAVCSAALGWRAKVLPYGLGVEDATLPMGDWETDGCSFTKNGDQVGAMREIGRTFWYLAIDRVDLMLMNIEGYEYTLIPHMFARGILPDRLMVQCHGDAAQTADLFDQLDRAGYRIAWTYGAVLTAWERT